MARRLVAADASPLIGLAAADAFGLLQELFATVVVTTAVRDEVLAGEGLPGAKELEAAVRAGWIEVKADPQHDEVFPELGPGEASTLLLALRHEDECLVLMDDPVGRARARAQGVPVTGLAGVLLAAKQAGLVERVRPILERLAETDFRISEEVVLTVLEEADEDG